MGEQTRPQYTLSRSGSYYNQDNIFWLPIAVGVVVARHSLQMARILLEYQTPVE
jgi:hypothetical protein